MKTQYIIKIDHLKFFGLWKKGIIIICLFQLIGCSTVSQRQKPERVNPALLMPVIDLIDNEAAVITITRATGTQGTIHPLLAKAIGAENKQGTKVSSNSHLPSSTEIMLNDLLKISPHYSTLTRLLNPDNNIEPSASANFSIDYSNFSENTVTFDGDKSRKSYTYEVGLSFRLINNEGKLVYERKFVNVGRQICIIQAGQSCLEIRSKQKINPEQAFLKTLKSAYHEALLESAYGLHAWAEVLRHLKAVVTVYHNSGSKLSVEQSALWKRKKEQANQRYLYISLPSFRVQLNQLFKDLDQRSKQALSKVDKKQLTNFMTTVIRSHLDQKLQAHLEKSNDYNQSGIFLLPDPNATWFQDALSVLIARVINQENEGIVSTDEGFKYNDSTAFDNSCSTLNRVDNKDACLSMNVKYYKSLTEPPVENENVVYTKQTAFITGVLLNPKESDKQKRYFPKGKKPLVNSVGSSDTYVTIKDEKNKVKDNEDRIYLREAAQKAAENLAAEMVENIILTFQQTTAENADR